MFNKAVRPQVKLKVMLYGVPGSGKTYSSLRLAKGISPNGKIAMINSEGERGYLYADKFQYDIMDLDNHSPEAYVRAIQAAVDAGYECLIIDSVSHERQYMLDRSSQKGRSFYAWKDLTPRHNKFIEAIALGNIHIISTSRSKIEYTQTQKEGGGTEIKKMGTSLKQREGIEYEYMVSLLVGDNHKATVSKDNTHVFYEGHDVLLDEDTGSKLAARANMGEAYQVNEKLTAASKINKGLHMAESNTQVSQSQKLIDMCTKLFDMGEGMITYRTDIVNVDEAVISADEKKFISSFIDYVTANFELPNSKASQGEAQGSNTEVSGGSHTPGQTQQVVHPTPGHTQNVQGQGSNQPQPHQEGGFEKEIPTGG